MKLINLNSFLMDKKRSILTVVTLIVICALLHRGYPTVGFVSTMIVLGVYILLDLRKTIAYISHFKSINRHQQIKSITAIALAAVLVTSIISEQIPYFFMLVLLAADYMIYDNQTKK